MSAPAGLSTTLAEWRAAWQGRHDNPLRIYFELAARRARARLPWWRRYIFALAVGTLVLIALLAEFVDRGSGGPGGIFLDLIETCIVYAGFFWLALVSYDVTRDALSLFARPGQRDSRQRVDDMLILGALSPAELLLGGLYGPVRRMQYAALFLTLVGGWGVVSQALNQPALNQGGYSSTGQWIPLHGWMLPVEELRDASAGDHIDGVLDYLATDQPLAFAVLILPLQLCIGFVQALLLPIVLLTVFAGLAAGLKAGATLMVAPFMMSAQQALLIFMGPVSEIWAPDQSSLFHLKATGAGIMLACLLFGVTLALSLPWRRLRLAVIVGLSCLPLVAAVIGMLPMLFQAIYATSLTGEPQPLPIDLSQLLSWVGVESNVLNNPLMWNFGSFSTESSPLLELLRQLSVPLLDCMLLPLALWFAYGAAQRRRSLA